MDNIKVAKKNLNIDKSIWKLTKLGDLASDISKRVDNPAQSEYDRFVGLNHFVSGDLKIKKYGSTKNIGSSMKAFQKGDILFARRNAYLRRASMVEFDGCCSGDALVIREDNDKVVSGYLAFVMNSDALWDYANSNAAGTMSKRVKWRDLAEYEFLLPPKVQQTQMAELLWAMDDVIQKEKEALENNNRLTFSFREKFISKGNFPIKPLHVGLTDIVAGKSLNGENIPVKSFEKGVLKVSAVGPKGFDSSENKILNNQQGFLEAFKVKKGDLLITRANTTELVGRTCLAEEDYPNLMLCDKTLKLVYNEQINPYFLNEALKSFNSRRQIESYATGTGGAMKNITQSEIKSIKIPFPEKKVQDELAQHIINIKKCSVNLESKITSSEALQKSLFNQIF